ncbi:alpha-1A adrenergic receptor-like [Ornithodoros turicata]|uniref:alpha-1A adrenergic receptor-like n=1 Tax=Ornithodoros turicata TaxID=34597 RepID=UPI0031397B41
MESITRSSNVSESLLVSIAFLENYSSYFAEDLNVTSYRSTADVDLTTVILKGGLLLFLILLTITGNVMVLMAVLLNSNLRTTTNCFIINLALADLLLGASVLPFSATLELLDKQWFFGQIFCNIWAATDVLCCTASINSLCVISVDRYIGVTRPLTYSTIVTHKRAVLACILVWLLSVVISVGPLFGWREPPPSVPYVCEVTKQTGYVVFSVAFSFYIPTFIILVLYYRIYKAAARQTKFLETGVKIIKPSGDAEQLTLRVHTRTNRAFSGSQCDVNGTDKGQKLSTVGIQGRLAKFKRQKKAAKTLGIVVGVFIMCWFPFFFILPLSTLCKSCTIPPLLFDFCFWTGYMNSCLNPFIYASTSREYKRAFRAILRCQWSKHRDGGSSPYDAHGNWTGSKSVTYTLRSLKGSVDERQSHGLNLSDQCMSEELDSLSIRPSPVSPMGRLNEFKASAHSA